MVDSTGAITFTGLSSGIDTNSIVTQLVAVNHALDRAGFAIIASSLKQCLAEPGGADSADAKNLEKLFLSLA